MECETSFHDKLGMNSIGRRRKPEAPLVPILPKDEAARTAPL